MVMKQNQDTTVTVKQIAQILQAVLSVNVWMATEEMESLVEVTTYDKSLSWYVIAYFTLHSLQQKLNFRF